MSVRLYLTPVFEPLVGCSPAECWTLRNLSDDCQRKDGHVCGCAACLLVWSDDDEVEGAVRAYYWSSQKLVAGSRRIGSDRKTLWGTLLFFDQKSGWLRIGPDGFNLSRVDDQRPEYAGRLVRRCIVHDRMNDINHNLIAWATPDQPEQWSLFEADLAYSPTSNRYLSMYTSVSIAVRELPPTESAEVYIFLLTKIEEVRVVIEDWNRRREMVSNEMRRQLLDAETKARLAAFRTGIPMPKHSGPVVLPAEPLNKLINRLNTTLKEMVSPTDPGWASLMAQMWVILGQLNRQIDLDRNTSADRFVTLRTKLMDKHAEGLTDESTDESEMVAEVVEKPVRRSTRRRAPKRRLDE